MLLEWQIAKRYLKSKRKESFVTFISWFATIGIMIGVATLIIVMSVMNGFRKEIVSSLIGANGHITVFNNVNTVQNYNSLSQQLLTIQGVIHVGSIVQEQVLATAKNGSTGVFTWGITSEDLQYRSVLSNNITETQFNQFDTLSNAILLGRVVARNLGVSIDDTISLISPNGYITAFGTIPKILTFKVIGIINTGMYQYDSVIALINLKTAQDFFNYPETEVQKLDVFSVSPDKSIEVSNNIKSSIPNLYLETWQQSNSYLINALEVERNVMFLILSLIIFIAAFNIISGLVMLVRSKTKEIAILRTMGLSRKSIIQIFLLLGIRIGLLGTIIGSIIGVLFSLNIERIRKILELFLGNNLFAEEIYFLSKLPADIQSYQVIAIIFIAIFFTIISSIYPAILASRIKPVNGIKYE